MSTGYWAYNPAQKASSDASALKILQSYNANYVHKLKAKPLKTATLIQRLAAGLLKTAHAFFVRFPKWIGKKVLKLFQLKKTQKTSFVKTERTPLLARAVPLPSAPLEDPC